MPSAEEYVRLAEGLVEDAGCFKEAAVLFEWAAELDDSPSIQTALALSLLKCGKGAEALDAARRAVAETPDDAKVQNALGLAFASQMDEHGATRAFDRSIELDPTDYAPYFNRGFTAFQFGRYRQAAQDFVRAMLLLHGILEHRLKYSSEQIDLCSGGAIPRLIEKFRKEAGREEADAFRILDLVGTYVEEPDKFPKDAGRRLRVPGDLAWTVPVIRFIAEYEWQEFKRNARIVRFLHKAIALAPKDTALRWTRVNHLACKKVDESVIRKDLAILVKRHPKQAQIRSRWLSLLRDDAEYEEALAFADRWLEDDPESWEALDARANLLQDLGEDEAALDVYERLIQQYEFEDVSEIDERTDPLVTWDVMNHVEILAAWYEERAECLAFLERQKEAERDFERVTELWELMRKDISLEPGRTSYYNSGVLKRARWHARLQMWKEALADFDAVIAAGPVAPTFLGERAEVKEHLGDAKGAAEDRAQKAELAEQEKRKQEGRGQGKS